MEYCQGYSITNKIYQGEESLIWQAVRNEDGENVILKVINSDYPSEFQLNKLRHNFDIQQRCDHPNISKALDYTGYGNHFAIVMEDVSALSLEELYTNKKGNKGLTLDRFFPIAIGLAESIEYLHSQEILHKNICPANVIYNDSTDQIQLIDFGIATLLAKELPTTKTTSLLEGNLSYLSPEQTGRMNRAIDYRSDYYALGATLYHLLVGSPTFTTTDRGLLVHHHLTVEPTDPCKLRSSLPSQLAHVVLKLLEKNAEDRYQSATGLLYDLRKCKQSWDENSSIPEFELALRDQPTQFEIPQKLYGREKETAALMASFDRVAEGARELLIVSGAPGVGKSTLVKEVHKSIGSKGGEIIHGKFSESLSQAPYDALSQAIQQWVDLQLSTSDDTIAQWRETLNNALEGQGRLLVDLVPELELIIGATAEVPKLVGREAAIRLLQVLRRFFSSISTKQPLVIFLDDLQWADIASLALLPELLKVHEDGHLLLVVTYRENNLSENRLLALAIEELTNASPRSEHLLLENLGLKHIRQLLAATFRLNENDVREFAEMVNQKTLGNPFFITEFLHDLAQQDLIYYEKDNYRWRWHSEAINKQQLTPNVIDLLINKIYTLPADTQRLLQRAACLGATFDIEYLSLLTKIPHYEIVRQLWPAIDRQMIIPHDVNQYTKYLIDEKTTGNLRFRFLHDRFIQAAYESIDNKERAPIHLKIGRLILQKLATAEDSIELQQKLFFIVGQFNKSQHLIEEEDEKVSLAVLNLEAAKRAQSSAAFGNALEFSLAGVELLPSHPWLVEYTLTRELYMIAGESMAVTGDIEQSEFYYELAFQNAKDNFDKAEVIYVKLKNALSVGDYQAVYDKSIIGLALLDITLPLNEEELKNAVKIEEEKIQSILKDDPISRLKTLKPIEDQKISLALEFLSLDYMATILLNKADLNDYLVNFGVRCSLEHGQTPNSALLIAAYASKLEIRGEFAKAYALGELALSIAEEEPNHYTYVQTILSSGISALHLGRSFEETYNLHLRGYYEGLRTGNIYWAIANHSNSILYQLARGINLSEILQLAERSQYLSDSNKIQKTSSYFLPLLLDVLRSDSSNQEESIKRLNDQINATPEGSLHVVIQHFGLHASFWTEPQETALAHAIEAQHNADITPVSIVRIEGMFQHALLIIQCAQNNSTELALVEAELAPLQERLKRLSELNPTNFGHMNFMIEAEKSWLKGETIEAITYFTKAIESTRNNQFLQYQALASERLGRLWLEQGNSIYAKQHLSDAYYLYDRWGCNIKLTTLKAEFDESFNLSVRRSSRKEEDNKSKISPLNPLTHLNDSIDLNTVIHAAQSISSEISTKQLLDKIMTLIIENAGATAGSLLMMEHHKPQYVINAKLEGSVVKIETVSRDETENSAQLPTSVLKYVTKTGNDLVLNDLEKQDRFNKDPYFNDRQVRSVLATTIKHQDRIVGVLYLDNKLSTDAFTPERVQVLNILTAQAAIALENALLYQGLEQHVAERTLELTSTTQELQNFSYAISNDLRVPFRSIFGFSEMIQEDYADKLDEDGKMLLDKIKSACDEIRDYIDTILEFSKLAQQPLTRESFNLSDLVRNKIDSLLALDPDSKAKIVIAPDIMGYGDLPLVMQVIDCLLENAWFYASEQKIPEIEFGIHKTNEYFIRDNGAVIDPNRIESLFVPFPRLHKTPELEGPGIKLATATRIIVHHGGHILIEEGLEHGATFHFTLSPVNAHTSGDDFHTL